MRLGELIKRLEACKPDSGVSFDFCGCVPDGIDSWRGVYADLALGWTHQRKTVFVGELLTVLRGALGKTYTGYKGGEYLMTEYTEVHVDNYSEWTSTALVGVFDDGHWVYLETRRGD